MLLRHRWGASFVTTCQRTTSCNAYQLWIMPFISRDRLAKRSWVRLRRRSRTQVQIIKFGYTVFFHELHNHWRWLVYQASRKKNSPFDAITSHTWIPFWQPSEIFWHSWFR